MSKQPLYTSPDWQAIVDTLQEGLFVVDASGVIVAVNKALLELLGYSREELLGQTCIVLGCDACQRRRLPKGGPWCTLFTKRDSLPKQCSIRRKDGGIVPVLKNQALLLEDGQATAAVESVVDLTPLQKLDQEVRHLRGLLGPEHGFHGLVGQSAAMREVYRLIQRAAASQAPVLILGESGTGKELAARAIHELSARRDKPFVQMNCAAISLSLLESELFGHIKGAFTGAIRHRQGRFEMAAGGTLFLDEIGDMPPQIQTALLRVLETGSFERVGESVSTTVDVRLVSATNQPLAQLVEQGRFRRDFFYRINVLPIVLPPLRERPEDLALLCGHLLAGFCPPGATAKRLSPAAMRMLLDHSWPGNVRELRGVMEYAQTVCDAELIEPVHLPASVFSGTSAGAATEARPACRAAPDPALPGDDDRARERNELLEALARTGGNQSRAARLLGVNRLTVANRLRKHGIDLKRLGLASAKAQQ